MLQYNHEIKNLSRPQILFRRQTVEVHPFEAGNEGILGIQAIPRRSQDSIGEHNCEISRGTHAQNLNDGKPKFMLKRFHASCKTEYRPNRTYSAMPFLFFSSKEFQAYFNFSP